MRRHRRAGAQALARRLTRPCAGINVAHDTQPVFSFLQGAEMPHVQTEALTAILETAADKESETLKLGCFGVDERHRRRRGTQVDDERIASDCSCAAIRRISMGFAVGCQLWLQRHVSP